MCVRQSIVFFLTFQDYSEKLLIAAKAKLQDEKCFEIYKNYPFLPVRILFKKKLMVKGK